MLLFWRKWITRVVVFGALASTKQPHLLFGWKIVSSCQPSHEDGELSAPSLASWLPSCCHASCYNGNKLNIWNCKPGPIKYLPLNISLVTICLLSNGNSKTEVSTTDLSITMIGLAMFLFGAMWNFRLWICTCIKLNLIGHARRNVEHIGTGEWFELCICFYNVLLKNIFAFWPCLKSDALTKK